MRTILNEIRGKITSLDYKIASSNNVNDYQFRILMAYQLTYLQSKEPNRYKQS